MEILLDNGEADLRLRALCRQFLKNTRFPCLFVFWEYVRALRSPRGSQSTAWVPSRSYPSRISSASLCAEVPSAFAVAFQRGQIDLVPIPSGINVNADTTNLQDAVIARSWMEFTAPSPEVVIKLAGLDRSKLKPQKIVCTKTKISELPLWPLTPGTVEKYCAISDPALLAEVHLEIG
jgi:hypothetical protein